MALPTQGSVHISVENMPQEISSGRVISSAGAYTCVARLGGTSEVARATNATRATAIDAVLTALRAHPQGDLTLLPLVLSTGGAVGSPKII